MPQRSRGRRPPPTTWWAWWCQVTSTGFPVGAPTGSRAVTFASGVGNQNSGARQRYPSRRILAWRLLKTTGKPSTCGHFFEYCPVGCTGRNRGVRSRLPDLSSLPLREPSWCRGVLPSVDQASDPAGVRLRCRGRAAQLMNVDVLPCRIGGSAYVGSAAGWDPVEAAASKESSARSATD
jgi:hypothetical protein